MGKDGGLPDSLISIDSITSCLCCPLLSVATQKEEAHNENVMYGNDRETLELTTHKYNFDKFTKS